MLQVIVSQDCNVYLLQDRVMVHVLVKVKAAVLLQNQLNVL